MAGRQAELLLVVVAKAPVAGQVKTRLIPPLKPGEAVALYRCFLQDRMRMVRTLKGIDLALAFTPADAGDMFAAFSRNGVRLFAQKGKDLGERLNHIFVANLAGGYDAVCVIDSDSPDLPPAFIRESFRRLLSHQDDVVFGPCYDGGYYLVGMRKPHPELFYDIPWSTAAVLARTLEKSTKLGLNAHLLPSWNDLDTFQDLMAFHHKYARQRCTGAWAGEKTFRYLARLAGIAADWRRDSE